MGASPLSPQGEDKPCVAAILGANRLRLSCATCLVAPHLGQSRESKSSPLPMPPAPQDLPIIKIPFDEDRGRGYNARSSRPSSSVGRAED